MKPFSDRIDEAEVPDIDPLAAGIDPATEEDGGPEQARIFVIFDGGDDRDLDPMLADISNALVEAGHVIGNIFAGVASDYPNPVLLKSQPVIDLEKRKVGNLAKSLSGMIREHSPDVVIAASRTTRDALARIRFRKETRPYIIFYENGTVHAGRAWLHLRKSVLETADRVITTSHAARARILSEDPRLADKVVALLPPLISPAMEYRRRVPSQHPWLEEEDCPVLISCDPLTASRHQLMLMDEMAHFNRTTDVRLIMLGTGENRHLIEERIDNLGIRSKVDIIPDIADPLPFIARASALIHTEPSIGIPRTIVEALSLSCPVIAINHADAVSEIIMTRFCAKHVSPHDPGALAHAIAGILSRPGAAVNGLVGKFRNTKVLSSHIDACLGRTIPANRHLSR